ncbi:exported hypothetical protein [Actinacidiphila bryophytorum]|uniref:Uncharacterized protein n=1 Tax=Actinacidiphila bryophytorum TaxID=1436133 RepID=A0A9W4GYB0_9ACTN|nr:exported hypothetical protein [Actinacidiphila bryophytorum]
MTSRRPSARRRTASPRSSTRCWRRACTCPRRRSSPGSCRPHTTSGPWSVSLPRCPPPHVPQRRPTHEFPHVRRRRVDRGARGAARRGPQPRRRPVRPRARLPPVGARPEDGRPGRRAPGRAGRHLRGGLAAGARPGDGDADREGARPRPGRRPAAHRGGQHLRGQDLRRRRRRAAQAGELEVPDQPLPAELGRAVRRPGRADDRGARCGAGRGPRARGGVRQPPAAHLGGALLRRAAQAVARPAPPPVHAGERDEFHLPRRRDRLGRLLGARHRPGAPAPARRQGSQGCLTPPPRGRKRESHVGDIRVI